MRRLGHTQRKRWTSLGLHLVARRPSGSVNTVLRSTNGPRLSRTKMYELEAKSTFGSVEPGDIGPHHQVIPAVCIFARKRRGRYK